MRLIKTGLILMAAAALIAGCGGDDGGYNTKTVEGITLSWRTNDADDSLLVKVSATTIGMVLIGFYDDPLNGLRDANIITGYVVSDTAYVRDNYGTGEEAYAPDTTAPGGTDDVTEKDGSEVEGVTEISFTIPLNSGDARDIVLELGQEHVVFLAWGTNDSHYSSFTVHVSTVIEL
ncbi:MAG: hypothetical protein JSW49_00350 [candidate division WOR-3 bacterium]|nr:MAG: hypothetical protein JSW49_00350 [candidate division WOR-3 bacterium]